MEDMAIEFGDMLKDTLDKMSEKVPPFVQVPWFLISSE
jgi:hypothetical protein